MLGASFLPARLRHEHEHTAVTDPGYINRHITSVLQVIARSAFTHPIHTIVFFEGSLSEHTVSGNEAGRTNITSLTVGGRQLSLGPQTSWKWRTESSGSEAAITVRYSV